MFSLIKDLFYEIKDFVYTLIIGENKYKDLEEKQISRNYFSGSYKTFLERNSKSKNARLEEEISTSFNNIVLAIIYGIGLNFNPYGGLSKNLVRDFLKRRHKLDISSFTRNIKNCQSSLRNAEKEISKRIDESQDDEEIKILKEIFGIILDHVEDSVDWLEKYFKNNITNLKRYNDFNDYELIQDILSPIISAEKNIRGYYKEISYLIGELIKIERHKNKNLF